MYVWGGYPGDIVGTGITIQWEDEKVNSIFGEILDYRIHKKSVLCKTKKKPRKW